MSLNCCSCFCHFASCSVEHKDDVLNAIIARHLLSQQYGMSATLRESLKWYICKQKSRRKNGKLDNPGPTPTLCTHPPLLYRFCMLLCATLSKFARTQNKATMSIKSAIVHHICAFVSRAYIICLNAILCTVMARCSARPVRAHGMRLQAS